MFLNILYGYTAISCLLFLCDNIDKTHYDESIFMRLFTAFMTIVGTPIMIILNLLLRKKFNGH